MSVHVFNNKIILVQRTIIIQRFKFKKLRLSEEVKREGKYLHIYPLTFQD